MYTFEDILRSYTKQVSLPWQADAPPEGRVWMLWYDKSMQRRFSSRLSEFEHATMTAGYGWKKIDISNVFPEWLSKHELFEGLLEHPAEIRGLLSDFECYLSDIIKKKLTACSGQDVLAVDGCGSLFGLVRLSSLLSNLSHHIPGRLLIGFPGKHTAGVYRLLDARDGWNYHAVPIPAESTQ